MYNKSVLFLLTLFLIVLSLSCVSAQDIDNSTVLSDTDLGFAADLNELSDMINQSEDAQTITLEKDYKSDVSSDQIIIKKSITLDGQNHIIEAPDVKRVFLVEADNVCIKNINFINSRTTGLAGGAVSWLGSNGTLENCSFTNSSASSAGGAVCWMGNSGKITDCSFKNNKVVYGPAVSLTKGESFDPSVIHIQIVNSEGGAIFIGGNDIAIDNCRFFNNTALLNGGAISAIWGNNLSVSSSRFKNNNASYHGGAIDLNSRNAVLTDLSFFNNTPDDLFANDANLTLKNCIFKNKSCIESLYDINFTDVKFGIYTFEDLIDEINEVPEGGILVLDRNYEFTNGSNRGIIISKSITVDGAGHTLDGKRLSRIFNITADGVTVKNINFINGNSLGSYGKIYGGGAIYWNGSRGCVENCNFTGNALYSFEYDPYAPDEIIDDENGISFHISTVGATTAHGGAISWTGDWGIIRNCSFTHNHVGYANDGGAVFWSGSNGQIINSEFLGNDAFRGAALYWSGANGTVSLSKFINDGMCDDGIFWTGSGGVVKNSILLSRYGFQNVISIYSVKVKADFNFWGDTFENPNQANKSKDVRYWILMNCSCDRDYVFEGENFTVNYKFTHAISKSGKTYLYRGLSDKSGSAVLTSNKTGLLKLSYNKGFTADAVAYNSTGDFYDLLVKIHNTPEGGLLVLDRDYEFINGSNRGVLISRSITIDGAGHTLNGNKLSRIFNITADNVTLKNINFVNGNALGKYFTNINVGGGAIYWSGADGFAENCSFTNNTCSGIENDPFGKEEQIIDENGLISYSIRFRPMGSKINEGGAIVWAGAKGTVSKCVFKTNRAGYPNSGGAISWRGDEGRIVESEFYYNDAWAGAAVCWTGDDGAILYSKFLNTGSIFGRDIMWFAKNGTVKYSFLISENGMSPLYAYSANVSAESNFWGDTLDNPNKSSKIENLNSWIVLNATYSKNFIHKGDNISVKCGLLLYGSDGKADPFSGLNVSGNITSVADRDGFIMLTFDEGSIGVKIVPKTKIVSKDLTKFFKQSKQFKVRIYGADGKVASEKYVNFTVGKSVFSVKTDKKGYATLKFNKKPGKYTVYVKYDDVLVKNKITVKTVLITKNVSKKVKKSGKFTVKTLNSKGKAVKNKVVKIKFKGKTYKIKSNKKGMAVFNIPKNLKVGKYTIKTTYMGITNTNKISVKK